MAWTFCQPAARAGSAAAQPTTGQNTRAGAGGGSSSSWAGRGGRAAAAPSMSRRLRGRPLAGSIGGRTSSDLRRCRSTSSEADASSSAVAGGDERGRGRSRRRADLLPCSSLPRMPFRSALSGVTAAGRRKGGGSLPSLGGPACAASPTLAPARPPSPRPRGLSCAPPVAMARPGPQAAMAVATSGPPRRPTAEEPCRDVAVRPTAAPRSAADASMTASMAIARARGRADGESRSGGACSQPWRGRARAAARSSRVLRRPRWKGGRPRVSRDAGKAALAAATGFELRVTGGHCSGEAGPPGRNGCGNQWPTTAANRGGALQGRRGQADSRAQERRRREHGGQHGHRTGAWPRRRRVALRRGLFPTLAGQSSRGSSVQQGVAQASLEGGSPSCLNAPRQGDPP